MSSALPAREVSVHPDRYLRFSLHTSIGSAALHGIPAIHMASKNPAQIRSVPVICRLVPIL